MARALESSELIEVPFDRVRLMLDTDPRLLWNVTRLLATRLRVMDEVLADSVFLDVTGRTAKRLLELATRFQGDGAAAKGHDVALIEQLLAVDAQLRAAQHEREQLTAEKNRLGKDMGPLMGQLKKAAPADQPAMQVRDAIRVLFPEAVTLVREAREGLS